LKAIALKAVVERWVIHCSRFDTNFAGENFTKEISLYSSGQDLKNAKIST